LNISIKSEDKNKLEFEISYDLEEYDKTYNKILNKFRNKVKIPGFRPGKAPDNMVKNAVGEDAIFEELKKEIRDSSIEKIFNENKEFFLPSNQIFLNFRKRT